MSSIRSIVDAKGYRDDRREANPLYEYMKKDDINIIRDYCLIIGYPDYVYNDASVALGILMRARNIEFNFRKRIIKYLKKLIKNEKDIEEFVSIIDIFSGWACKKSNIPDIASDGFIQFMTYFAKSPEENIQAYTLELFLILAENNFQVEYEIRYAVDDYGLLDITGTFGLEVDYRAFVYTYKWGNHKLLNTIIKIIKLRDDYEYSDPYKYVYMMDNYMFSDLYSIIKEANDQVSKSVSYKSPVSSLTMGIINNICAFVVSALNNNQEIMVNRITKTKIPQILISSMKNIPSSQIKGIYILVIYHIAADGFDLTSYELYKYGAAYVLSKSVTKPMAEMVVINSLVCLQNLVGSGLQVVNSESTFKYYMSLRTLHPYYDDFQQFDILGALEQCINDFRSSAKICSYASRVLAIVCKGRVIPSQRLRTIIASLKKSLNSKIFSKYMYNKYYYLQFNIEPIKFISLHSDNHWAIIESNILYTLVYNIYSRSSKELYEILLYFEELFYDGKAKMRYTIKEILPENYLWSLVDKKLYSLQFNKVVDFGDGFQHNPAFSSFLLNESVLYLLVWYKEDQRMDQICTIINYLEFSGIEELKGKNAKDDKWKKMKNQWDYLRKILQLVSEMKDQDMSVGAMVLVRTGISQYFFGITEEWVEEEIISISLSALNKISSEIDDFLLYNLISSYICKWIAFIIDECKHRRLSSVVKEYAVYYAAYLAIRGEYMSYLMEVNRLSYPIFEGYLDKALLGIVLEYYSNNKKKQVNYINEKIKLKAAIAYSCCRVYVGLEEYALKVIVSLFSNRLDSFMNYIQQYSQTYQSNYNQYSIKDEIYGIDIKEIENTRDVLFAISALGFEIDIIENLINIHKIQDHILPLIHINCSCPQSIKTPNSIEISNIVSASFHALTNIWYSIIADKKVQLSTYHNLLNHIISLIFSFSEQISTNQYKQLFDLSKSNNLSYDLIRRLLGFLYAFVYKPFLFIKQLIEYPDAIESIVKLASKDIIPGLNKIDQYYMIFYSSEVIYYISMNVGPVLINKLIHYLNIIKLISKHVCSPGGGGIDNDDIIGSSLRNFTNILKNLEKKKSYPREKQLLDDAKEKIEEYGLVQEDDAMLFYYDKRYSIGVFSCARDLYYKLQY